MYSLVRNNCPDIGLDRGSARNIRINGQLIDVTSEAIAGWTNSRKINYGNSQ